MHFDQLGSIQSDSGSLSDDLSGNQNVFQNRVVNGSESSRLGDFLGISSSLVDDGSFGNHKGVLFSFFAEIVANLFDLAFVFFVVRERHVDNQSGRFVLVIIGELELFDFEDLGVFEELAVFLIGVRKGLEVFLDFLEEFILS